MNIPNSKYKAITKKPGKSFVYAINDWYGKSTQGNSGKINLGKTLKQHAKYTNMLKDLGVEVKVLSADESYPDGCFTQDPMLVYKNSALKLKQFAKTRQGEGNSLAKEVKNGGIKVNKMKNDFCDGGDVLVVDELKTVWCGTSERTNIAGFKEIKKFYTKFKFEVIPVPVINCLHLMTAITYLGKNHFLVSSLLDENLWKLFKVNANVKFVKVPEEENYAVNIININNTIIMPKGYPKTKKLIKKSAFEIKELEMSEFEKADGGITCLSLLF